ncbi:hypothetical protein SDC9_205351 [bioreactor metagenome]|uniref:Uncharacterized protein n=1 Tax=bioreactor metagenome TaxID=1076179 RepID=A0A645J2M6_9ZZZZ
MAAKVVDFPLPVGPVTSTNPLGFSAKVFRISGCPSCSKVGILSATNRMTMATVPRCRNALIRNRLNPGIAYEKSNSPVVANLSRCSNVVSCSNNAFVSLGIKGAWSLKTRLPFSLNAGGTPTVICKSEAFRITASRNKLSIISVPHYSPA